MAIKLTALALSSSVLALLWIIFPLASEPARLLATPSLNAQSAPLWQRSSLPPAPTAHVHALSVAEVADNELLALWYGGSREGGRDIALYQSSYRNGAWQEAQLAFDKSGLQRALGRNLKTLGNPVLFQHPRSQRLWLFFVSTSYGGWAGSSLNFSYRDPGGGWSLAQRLISAPLLNLSTLAKYPPLALADGGLLLPAYHELIGKYSELLHLSPEGALLDKIRISFGRKAIQPSLHRTNSGILALMRNSSRGDDCCQLWVATASAPAWRFGELALQPVNNPHSAAASLSLDNTELLLAYNDSRRDRSNLSLRLRDGDGWGSAFTVAEQAGARYGYPWLLADSQGRIHLFYTQDRKSFAHLMFNRAWLNANL